MYILYRVPNRQLVERQLVKRQLVEKKLKTTIGRKKYIQNKISILYSK